MKDRPVKGQQPSLSAEQSLLCEDNSVSKSGALCRPQ